MGKVLLFVRTLVVLIVVMVAGSCGGRFGLVPERGPGGETRLVNGRVEWDYDYSGYPTKEGLSIVPMVDEFRVAPAESCRYDMQVATKGAVKRIELTANGADKVLMHLRYDPKKWRVGPVASLNPWNDGRDFIAFCLIPQSGLLVLYNQPKGDPVGAVANGVFAQLELEPANQRRTSELFPPSSEDEINVIWKAHPVFFPSGWSIDSSGTFAYKLDGEYGDVGSKDFDWDEGDDQSNQVSNLLQDVSVAPFYDPGGSTPDFPSDLAPVTVYWHERLTGDHDNNGVINISDMTPVGALDVPIEDTPVTRSQYRCKEDGEALDLVAAMHNVGSWLSTSTHDVIGYYKYVVGTGEADPEFTSVDSFWDGYVRQYKNLDVNNNDDLTEDLDGYFNYPPDFQEHLNAGGVALCPGDLAPMSGRFYEGDEEWIDGYRVWTVPAGAIEEDWQDETPASDIHLVETFFRVNHGSGDSEAPPEGFECQTYTKPLGYIRPLFTLTIDSSNFETLAQGYFDIVIQPYTFSDPDDIETLTYGPYTRIEDAIRFNASNPPATDDNGPQYNTGQEDPPDDHGSNPHPWGIVSATQVEGQFGEWDSDLGEYHQTYGLELEFVDADDVDAYGEWSSKPVMYDIYAIAFDPESEEEAPTDEELFDAENLVSELSFVEPNGSPDHSYHRTAYWDKSAEDWQELGIPLDVIDSRIYFGIRAKQAGVVSPAEYVHPGESWPKNDEVSEALVVADMAPPYFFEGVSETWDADAKGTDRFERATAFPTAHALEIWANCAIDPPTYSEDDVITYHCFWAPATETIDPEDPDANTTELDPIELSFAEIVGDDEKFHNLTWIIDELDEDTEYTYYVYAEDASNNRSHNTAVGLQKTALEDPPADDIVPDTSPACANHVGDILADSSGIKFVCGEAIVTGTVPSYVQLGYAERPYSSGWSSYIYENDITGSGGGAASKTEPYYDATVRDGSTCQLSLIQTVDATGTKIVNGDSTKQMMVSYSGVDISPLQVTMNTVRRTASDTWGYVLHSEEEEWEASIAGRLFDYKYKITSPSASFKGTNLLPWARGMTSGIGVPSGDLVFRTWNPTDGWSEDEEDLAYILDAGSGTHPYTCYIPDTWSLDIDVKASGIVDGAFVGFVTTNDLVPKGNKVYLLADSSPRMFQYQHTVLELFSSDTGQDDDWDDDVSLLSALPDLNLDKDSLAGCSSLEVARTSNSLTHYVHVAYCNSPIYDPPGDDVGLRVACSTRTAGGYGPWISPSGGNTAGVIDGSFYYAGYYILPSNDLVDLEVMPADKVASAPFTGLGCAYVDSNARLILKETDGSGNSAEWVERIVANGDPTIDRGLFRWVKLAYFDPDGPGGGVAIPCVLYAVRVNLSPEEYSIRLWTPE